MFDLPGLRPDVMSRFARFVSLPCESPSDSSLWDGFTAQRSSLLVNPCIPAQKRGDEGFALTSSTALAVTSFLFGLLRTESFGYPFAHSSLTRFPRFARVGCAGSLRSPAVARFARHASRVITSLFASLGLVVLCVVVGVHKFFSKSMEDW